MRETASLLRRANALNGPIYHPSPTLIRPGLDNRETGISPPPVHFPLAHSSPWHTAAGLFLHIMPPLISQHYGSLITEDGDGIPYRVTQRAGDWGITAENMEKSQHTDFNEDKTNESASVACSNIRL